MASSEWGFKSSSKQREWLWSVWVSAAESENRAQGIAGVQRSSVKPTGAYLTSFRQLKPWPKVLLDIKLVKITLLSGFKGPSIINCKALFCVFIFGPCLHCSLPSNVGGSFMCSTPACKPVNPFISKIRCCSISLETVSSESETIPITNLFPLRVEAGQIPGEQRRLA